MLELILKFWRQIRAPNIWGGVPMIGRISARACDVCTHTHESWGVCLDLQAIGHFWVTDVDAGLIPALETLGLGAQPELKQMYDLAARRGLLFASSVPFREFIFEELLARSVNKRILAVNDGRFTTSAACRELAPFFQALSEFVSSAPGLSEFFGALHKRRVQAIADIVCSDIEDDKRARPARSAALTPTPHTTNTIFDKHRDPFTRWHSGPCRGPTHDCKLAVGG